MDESQTFPVFIWMCVKSGMPMTWLDCSDGHPECGYQRIEVERIVFHRGGTRVDVSMKTSSLSPSQISKSVIERKPCNEPMCMRDYEHWEHGA